LCKYCFLTRAKAAASRIATLPLFWLRDVRDFDLLRGVS
jgi:hypothetical protein